MASLSPAGLSPGAEGDYLEPGDVLGVGDQLDRGDRAAGDREGEYDPGLAAQRPHDAERLARESVSLADQTDFLNFRGDAQADLAAVLELSGRTTEATTALTSALLLYQEKGNVVCAEPIRVRLDTLATA